MEVFVIIIAGSKSGPADLILEMVVSGTHLNCIQPSWSKMWAHSWHPFGLHKWYVSEGPGIEFKVRFK